MQRRRKEMGFQFWLKKKRVKRNAQLHQLPLKAPPYDGPGAWSSGGSRLLQTCIFLSVLACHCTLPSFHSADCPSSAASATRRFQAGHAEKQNSELQSHQKLVFSCGQNVVRFVTVVTKCFSFYMFFVFLVCNVCVFVCVVHACMHACACACICVINYWDPHMFWCSE